jgi:hypothetical protein
MQNGYAQEAGALWEASLFKAEGFLLDWDGSCAEGCCQFNANWSREGAHDPVLGDEKVSPLAKRGVPVDLEV